MVTEDYVETNNPDILLHLFKENITPDYVLESDRVTSEEIENLNELAFADPYNRKFPCHTKAATWQSAAWYAGSAGDNPYIKENIKKAAVSFDIVEDVDALFKHFNKEFEKAATVSEVEVVEEPKYALSLDFGGSFGRNFQQFYPITSASAVIVSGDKAYQDYTSQRLPMPVFRKVAQAIVKAASSFAVASEELPTQVISLGTDRLPDPFMAREFVGRRKLAGVDLDPYIDLIDQLDTALLKSAALDEDACDKAISIGDNIACKLYELDLNNNIRYDNRMLNPYQIIFTGPTLSDLNKAASVLVNIKNVQVPVVDFLNLSDDTLDATFSPTVSSILKEAKDMLEGTPTIEKTASVSEKIANLPDETQLILLKVLADTGW